MCGTIAHGKVAKLLQNTDTWQWAEATGETPLTSLPAVPPAAAQGASLSGRSRGGRVGCLLSRLA